MHLAARVAACGLHCQTAHGQIAAPSIASERSTIGMNHLLDQSADQTVAGEHPRRDLGDQLSVFPVALGTNVFGWTSNEDEAHEVLDAYTSGGGNFVDTADSYPHWVEGREGGESEATIGTWLAKPGTPSDVLIATKVAKHPKFPGLAPDNVRASLDESLRRLGRSSVDLYYAHHDDQDVPLVETIATFSALVDEGKVRAIGLSNFEAPRIREWLEITDREGFHRPVALQPHYNLMERGAEDELVPVALESGLGIVPYPSLANGFLTGKYRPGTDNVESPRAGSAASYLETPRGERVLGALDGISGRLKVQPGAVALAWLMSQPGVVAPITSARTASQVELILEAASIALDPSEIEELDRASSAE